MIKGEDFDLIIRNATIIDGTRMPRYAGSIGVRASKIADIGALDDAARTAELDGERQIACAWIHRCAHAR
jgi:N-acyl-D-amino-acid deacylase